MTHGPTEDHDALDALLATLQSPARPEELAAEEPVVHAMAALVTRPTPIEERRLMKRITPKAAGIAAAAFLSLGGVAAAASNGSLPAPVQDTVAKIASPVVDLPRSDDSPAGETHDAAQEQEHGATTTDPTGTTAGNGSATDPQPASDTANVTCPAEAEHHGDAVSQVAKSDDHQGADHGTAVSAIAKSDCAKHDQTPAAGTTTPPGGVSSHDDGTKNDGANHDATNHDVSNHDGANHDSGAPETHDATNPDSQANHDSGTPVNHDGTDPSTPQPAEQHDNAGPGTTAGDAPHVDDHGGSGGGSVSHDSGSGGSGSGGSGSHGG